jgi:hypothetical protein
LNSSSSPGRALSHTRTEAGLELLAIAGGWHTRSLHSASL